MKSSVEQINPVQCRVKVELSADEVNKAFDNAYRRLQKKARIQGFRPGKAPLNIIRKMYGGQVTSEVGESLINTHLFSALSEQTIRPIASPVVETADVPQHDVDFKFSAVVDVMPEIKIDEYKDVAVSIEKHDVEDDSIDREIEQLRKRHARTKPIEGEVRAAAGHIASISHTATIDGHEIDNMKVENAEVALGENQLYKDLEDAILGMTPGEVKQTTIKLPETYEDPEFAGKDVAFTITLGELKALDLPVFDDEFAKDLDYESADKLKSSIKGHLEARAQDTFRQKLETSILDKLLERYPFEVPPAMVDQVVDSMIQEMAPKEGDQRREALQNVEIRQSLRPTAKRRTQNTLVLWHVSQQEKLEVTDQEVSDKVDQTLASMGFNDPRQNAKIRQGLEARIRENLILEKAMDFLIASAKVTEIPVQL